MYIWKWDASIKTLYAMWFISPLCLFTESRSRVTMDVVGACSYVGDNISK